MSAPRQGCYMGKKGIMNPLMGSERATAFNSESKRDHGAVNGISNGCMIIFSGLGEGLTGVVR